MSQVQQGDREFVLFSPDDVARHWLSIENSLDRIPHTWKHTTKDRLKHQLLSGELQAWAVADPKKLEMMVLTQIADGALQVILAWGDKILDAALPLLDAGFDEFARNLDLERIEIVGRKGWERKLKPLGFKFERVILSRPVVEKRTKH